MAEPLNIGFPLFPRLAQPDPTGPHEALSRLPGAEVRSVWKSLGPVRADTGIGLLPNTTMAECPPLDLVCGPGVAALMEDAEVLDFLRRQAAGARYVSSVCTGVLGAAGPLRGKRATTRWASHDLLSAFGAAPVRARAVRDGGLFTGGGVTAGIDSAPAIAAEVAREAAAQAIQLGVEHAPAPPFAAGTPETAPAGVPGTARARGAPMARGAARSAAAAA